MRQREQLPRKAGRLLCSAQNRGQIELGLTAARRERELGVADDHRQQVVEVVSRAGRELADRLELLRRAKLAVERSLFGRVDEEADDDRVPLVIVPRDPRLVDQREVGAVGTPQPILLPNPLVLLQWSLCLGSDSGLVRGVEDLRDEPRPAELGGRVAEQRLDHRAHVDPFPGPAVRRAQELIGDDAVPLDQAQIAEIGATADAGTAFG